jgi:peptide/nickel transport system permease protein
MGKTKISFKTKIVLPFVFLVYPFSLLIYYLTSGCSPYEINIENKFLKPSLDFILGTNELGQNIACMIGGGILTSMKIASITSIICFILGMSLGMIAGYFGGIYDILISRIIEFFQGFPSLIFVIFIVALWGEGDEKIIISLSLFGWTSFARLARTETMKIKYAEFVISAKVIGLGTKEILARYIFPFVLPATLTQLMFSFSAFILAEGGLGFLGLRPAQSLSLGAIIADEIDFILTHPELVIYPGLALTFLSVFFNLIGQIIVSGKNSL